jgi:hypothetical protein
LPSTITNFIVDTLTSCHSMFWVVQVSQLFLKLTLSINSPETQPRGCFHDSVDQLAQKPTRSGTGRPSDAATCAQGAKPSSQIVSELIISRCSSVLIPGIAER